MKDNKTIIGNQTNGQSEDTKKSIESNEQINGTHFTKDVNARTVFQDPVMCLQSIYQTLHISLYVIIIIATKSY